MKTKLEEARDFALKAHGHQNYGSHPYVYHLDDVVGILAPYGEEAQIVGYLHDVIEDTTTRAEDIKLHFGERVAHLVAIVTDLAGRNRKQRKERTNAKLAAVSYDDVMALVVKAADRLANMRFSANVVGSVMMEMYRAEYPEFKKAVYRHGFAEELWAEMDKIFQPRRVYGSYDLADRETQ